MKAVKKLIENTWYGSEKTALRHLNITFVRSPVNAHKRAFPQHRFEMSVKVLSKTGESAECSQGTFAIIQSLAPI